MEDTSKLVPLLLSLPFLWILVSLIVNILRRRKTSAQKLPPGPRPFPVIGNFLELGIKPHISLTQLAKIHGSIISLKLGFTTAVIVSSPELAKEVLSKHDHVLADRAVPDSARVLNHDKISMVAAPVGPHWRDLRKICAIQLFSAPRLDASQNLRRKKVQELLDYVHERCDSGESVEIGRVAFTTSLNLLSNTFFSIDLAQYRSSNSQEFKNLVWGVMEETGRPNIADYIPFLRYIDPQGARRLMKFYLTHILRILDGIFEQRLKSTASSPPECSSVKSDVLDALINLAEERNDNDGTHLRYFKHLLMDLFIAGTDTTSSTAEWAMAELIRNPTKLTKAKKELEQILTKDKAVEESDISTLPYLQAIVKETLRLHPAAPLLLPHQARTDVEVNGCVIPKHSKVLVNVYAIGRDPNIWPDANSFVPERFLGSDVDFKGKHFELLPFGAGRRICPGLALADRIVPLMLASLVQSFDWKLEKGQAVEEMDMSDKFGITLQKAVPLRAVPIRA